PDPVATLEGQDESRLQELVPIRHGRMLASAFSFYRGAAAVMAADLAATPRTGLEVQLCGDAHLSNFGVFLAPDRRLVFDINDFDETLPGPFEWDLKRLAASFAIGGRALGLKAAQSRAVVGDAAAGYRQEIRRLAAMRDLDVWYSRLDVDAIEQFRSQVSKRRGNQFDKTVAKAESKNSLRALAKLTRKEGDSLRIASDPPLILPIEEIVDRSGAEIEAGLKALMDLYRRSLDPDIHHLAREYHYVHAARKVVGVGSVGTDAWIVLLIGRDAADPLFLQVKQAERSVLEPYSHPSRFKNQGRRVVEGQRLTQAASDEFLGWLSFEGVDGRQRDFYVRQLWDGKGSVDFERMDVESMRIYAKLCGWTLARAHARSGDRIAIATYLGRGEVFDRAICEFADAYAEQNQRDYDEFAAAVKSGRLVAQLNV
ncbi:MAG: hypothetical protein QOD14_2060, partial [Solirubrobacterales bacterium]|nr:hypothetical protein [Solirubrobacterales bacterium]